MHDDGHYGTIRSHSTIAVGEKQGTAGEAGRLHISLSGQLGSGKSTVCQMLKGRGYEIYSTGKILRGIARSLGLTALEINELAGKDSRYDYEIDREVARVAAERPQDNLVFDSRMAWFFVPSSLKVYLTVEPMVAARRVFHDHTRGAVERYETIEETARFLAARLKEENERYRLLYGVDNLDMGVYDLVVDTTCRPVNETMEIILSEVMRRGACRVQD